MRTQLIKSLGSLLIAGLLTLPVFVQAQPTAHYAPGLEGIKAATLPPPGLGCATITGFIMPTR